MGKHSRDPCDTDRVPGTFFSCGTTQPAPSAIRVVCDAQRMMGACFDLGTAHEEQAMQAFALHNPWIQMLSNTVIHENTYAIRGE